MTLEDPRRLDSNDKMKQSTKTNNTCHKNNDVDQSRSKLSEDDSRKMILESYERAGVDLPLVSLETILDRKISEDDARQSGAPRFRKFLNKASSAVANRALNSNSDFDEVPDDEPPVLTSSSYTSNSNIQDETPGEEPVQRDEIPESPQTPERALNESNTTKGATDVIPPTPESYKNYCHPTFDFCCPNTPTTSSPAKSAASDKYVMSNLQLAEGFDDEHESVNTRDVPALMDVEGSVLEGSYTTEKVERCDPISKGGNTGIMSIFRGSRRFRFAIMVCCLLHVVLVGLIISFVTNADNESYDIGSTSSTIPQDQTAPIPSSISPATDPVTSETLYPDPDLDKSPSSVVGETTVSNAVNITAAPSVMMTEERVDFEEEPKEQNITIAVGEEDQPLVPPDTSPVSCVNSLELSTNCVGEGSELLVYFESCTPRLGDWVAMYESSANPEFLLDSESVGWLYTCGDRFCQEAVEKEVLSFTRATGRVGIGTYRVHLIREGEGPLFPSIASSPEFQIVADADTSC